MSGRHDLPRGMRGEHFGAEGDGERPPPRKSSDTDTVARLQRERNEWEKAAKRLESESVTHYAELKQAKLARDEAVKEADESGEAWQRREDEAMDSIDALRGQRDRLLEEGRKADTERTALHSEIKRLKAQQAAVAKNLGTTPNDSLWEQSAYIMRRATNAEAEVKHLQGLLTAHRLLCLLGPSADDDEPCSSLRWDGKKWQCVALEGTDVC